MKYLSLLILFSTGLDGFAQAEIMEKRDSTFVEEIQIGYGQAEKDLVASSVYSIKGESVSKAISLNFENTLFGKFPGLFVNQRVGHPGNDSPTLRIRGALNSPLTIVDGYERDITYLSPEEIESIRY
ncbi:MAG: TonB-dependent receptor plug domain-containing protein [Bacteroidales bacterium]|nr:TonB-dependent receptor plug domain-containing protein [Bacteroidales bacterium]MBN2699094.1 TonB-dependent receptor plug domain-containing protein [Bacteroidales bacterium]